MTLYDKDGNTYEVKHAIDAKEWLSRGLYFEYSPEALIEDDGLVPDPIDEVIDQPIDEVVLQPTKKGK